MTIADKIRYEKLQYKIKREAAKISALLLEKMNKHDCLTDEVILISENFQIYKEKQSKIKD